MVEGIGYRAKPAGPLRVALIADGLGAGIHLGAECIAVVWTRGPLRRMCPAPGSVATVVVQWPRYRCDFYVIDGSGQVLRSIPRDAADEGNLGWLLDLALEAGLEID